MTPSKRYRNKIQKKNGCWNWMGVFSNGHPVFNVNGTRVQVRRWAWPGPYSSIPEYIGVNCGNRLCVRPEHLVAVNAGPAGKILVPPDKIVRFMIDHPKEHLRAMEKFNLTRHELIQILDTWYSSIPKAVSTRTAPMVRARTVQIDSTDRLMDDLLQLSEITEDSELD